MLLKCLIGVLLTSSSFTLAYKLLLSNAIFVFQLIHFLDLLFLSFFSLLELRLRLSGCCIGLLECLELETFGKDIFVLQEDEGLVAEEVYLHGNLDFS